MNKEVITVDIVSDVACPWCYVGKRRFEAALEQWNGTEIQVNWHPFQLDPTIPMEGVDRDTYLINKFGSIDTVKGMTDRLETIGKTVGIDFDFGKTWLAINTLPLHQLLHVAGEEGFKAELKERFLKAYFEEPIELNRPEALHSILTEFGWSAEKVDSIIADQSIASAVKAEISQYQRLGVSGVPFFIINNKYGISGAQETETFLEALTQVDSIPVVSDGESCEPGSGCC
jgi:predicted DsbA family dithiol-disulfide isomerase